MYYFFFLSGIRSCRLDSADLQVVCCLICLTSLVLLSVYVALPSSICGQVKHPCLVLQRNVPGDVFSIVDQDFSVLHERGGHEGKETLKRARG